MQRTYNVRHARCDTPHQRSYAHVRSGNGESAPVGACLGAGVAGLAFQRIFSPVGSLVGLGGAVHSTTTSIPPRSTSVGAAEGFGGSERAGDGANEGIGLSAAEGFGGSERAGDGANEGIGLSAAEMGSARAPVASRAGRWGRGKEGVASSSRGIFPVVT
jgi:hypothetical protein